MVGLAATPLSFADTQDRTALVAAIRSIYGGPEDAASLARASGWDHERALAVLTRAVPLTSKGETARIMLKERIRADFVEDRIHLVGRRWLSDTEVAIAVILFGRTG